MNHAVQTNFHKEDGNLIVENVQDCTPILEEAKRKHLEGEHGSSEMRHAAEFPFVLVQRYMNLHNITFREFMADKTHIRRMLSDPDLAGFRIWQGRVA
jgi:hypothetical protein